MPGITGSITAKPRAWAEAQLCRMLETMRHEVFYTSGSRVDESLGVYTGWVAHENSFSDGMPVVNEPGNVCLIFSGEEYPSPETIQQLKTNGHHLNRKGAEYLVHIYEDDPSFPLRL